MTTYLNLDNWSSIRHLIVPQSESNKKVIAERGWYPYNQYLMTNPHVRSSITEEEEELKTSITSSIILPVQTHKAIVDLSTEEPTHHPAYLSQLTTSTANFNSGVAAWCLDTIVKDHDVNTARGRIWMDREDGKTLKEKLVESKQITAGRLFKADSCRIGQIIFDIHKQRQSKGK